MAEFRPGTPEQSAFLAELIGAGLLIDSGVPGVYGRGAVFEDIKSRFDDLVSEIAADHGAESLGFPPVMPRRQLESAEYLKSFPHLAGSVFAFEGDESAAAEQNALASRHEDWSEFQQMTDLVLTPAVCYPVYPAIAARGPLPAGGVTINVTGGYAFRHEPSGDPARLQSFQMREMVRIGEPETVQAWRDGWRDRAIDLLRGVGLDADFEVAADPFFGRSGRMLAISQRQQELKFEILAPTGGPELTAVASFNYHQDHFAELYGIELAAGGRAHTACLGFGLERVVLALLHAHGLDTAGWPAAVRERLWPA